MEYTIRKMTVPEYPLLSDLLYEAIFIPDGIKPPPRDIIASPELQIYIERFGTSKDDFALVAEIERKIVGAVWVRIMDILMTKLPPLQSLCTKNTEGRGWEPI